MPPIRKIQRSPKVGSISRKQAKDAIKSIGKSKDSWECPCCGAYVNKERSYLPAFICFHCYRLLHLPVGFKEKSYEVTYCIKSEES